jgi:uncharacterized protein (UPF0333 family)
MLIDEKGQISAEMILLMGAIFVIVLIVAGYVTGITNDIANSVSDVVDAARDSTINRL